MCLWDKMLTMSAAAIAPCVQVLCSVTCPRGKGHLHERAPMVYIDMAAVPGPCMVLSIFLLDICLSLAVLLMLLLLLPVIGQPTQTPRQLVFCSTSLFCNSLRCRAYGTFCSGISHNAIKFSAHCCCCCRSFHDHFSDLPKSPSSCVRGGAPYILSTWLQCPVLVWLSLFLIATCVGISSFCLGDSLVAPVPWVINLIPLLLLPLLLHSGRSSQ